MYVSGVKEVQGPRSSFESAGTPLLKWGEVGGGVGGKFRQFFPYGCLEQPGILDLS